MKKAKDVFSKKIVRIILLILLDIASVALSQLLALWLHFDLRQIPQNFTHNTVICLGVDTIITIIIYAILNLYTSIWSYASITELIYIIVAVFGTILVEFIYKHAFHVDLPRSVYSIYAAILIFFTCGIRYSYRIMRVILKRIQKRQEVKNIMLIGGDEAARMIIDEMDRNKLYDNARVCCIIDDNKEKKDTHVRGIPVVGNRHMIALETNARKILCS